MDIGSLLLGLSLLLLIGLIVARPLLEQTGAGETPANPAEQVLASREQVLTQLRDLDFDQATGKINPEDYAAQRAQLVAEGVAILKQLDSLGTAAGLLTTASAAAPADEIEAAVARLRGRRVAAAVTSAPDATIQLGLIGSAPAPDFAKQNRAEPVRAPNGAGVEPALKPEPAPGRAPARASSAPRNLDDEIEAQVAERRAAGSARPPAPAKLACAQCAAEVLPDDRFCPRCGSALTIACGNCGRVARAGDQFCANCGQSLPAPASANPLARQAGVQG